MLAYSFTITGKKFFQSKRFGFGPLKHHNDNFAFYYKNFTEKVSLFQCGVSSKTLAGKYFKACF